jgi:hypothetical protein
MTDVVYASASITKSSSHFATVNLESEPISIPLEAQSSTGTRLAVAVWSVAGGCTLLQGDWGNIDAVAGIRTLFMDATTDYSLAANIYAPNGTIALSRVRSLNPGVTKAEGIGGVTARINIPHASFYVPFYLDAGGGAVRFTGQAAVDGRLIDPWHLAALLEGLRLRMDPALGIIERGEIVDAARHAFELYQWITAPDVDQEGVEQQAQQALAAAAPAAVPLLAAAAGMRAWLAHVLHCDPYVIGKMTQSQGRSCPVGLIASMRPMQVCRRCSIRHSAEPTARGARLRSWMEGWRLGCPVCGVALVDARPINLLVRVDPTDPLLASAAELARQGELIMTRAIRLGRSGHSLIVLMQHLLLPRVSRVRGVSRVNEIPRLLDVILPGFDRFLHGLYPGFRRPSTLLLPLNIRIPVLAGVAQIARQPEYWADRLLGAVSEGARPRLMECFAGLMASGARRQGHPNGNLTAGHNSPANFWRLRAGRLCGRRAVRSTKWSANSTC